MKHQTIRETPLVLGHQANTKASVGRKLVKAVSLQNAAGMQVLIPVISTVLPRISLSKNRMVKKIGCQRRATVPPCSGAKLQNLKVSLHKLSLPLDALGSQLDINHCDTQSKH